MRIEMRSQTRPVAQRPRTSRAPRRRHRTRQMSLGHSVIQHLRDGGDGIPVARGDRYPEDAVQRAEIADGLHVPPVQPDDEPVLPRENSHQPLACGRKAYRHRRRRTRRVRQNAHETNDVGANGVGREKVVRHEPHDLPAVAEHDLGIERKPAGEFNAQLRAADWLPDHKGAGCADVDGVEMLQLFGERRRSKGSVTADVDPPQKNHECHARPHIGTCEGGCYLARLVIPWASVRTLYTAPAPTM